MPTSPFYVYVVTLWLSWFSAQLIVTLVEQWHTAILQQSRLSRAYCAILITVFVGGLIASPLAVMVAASNSSICPVTASLSLLTAAVLLSSGVFIASRDRVFVRSKQKLFHLLLSELHRQPMSVARNRHAILFFALRKKCEHIIVGGLLTSFSMAIVIFGFRSNLFDLDSISLTPGLATYGLLLIFFFTVITFLLLFRVLIMFPQSAMRRHGSIMFISLGTCGVAYVLDTAVISQNATSVEAPLQVVFGITTTAAILLSVLQHIAMQCSRYTWQKEVQQLNSRVSEDEESVVEQLSQRLCLLPVKVHTRVRVRQVTPHFTLQPMHDPTILSTASKTRDADDEV